VRTLTSDPFAEFLETKVEEVRDGYARVSGRVKREFLNIHGTAHGAYITALADFALALASNYDTKRMAVNITINFFKGAEEGDELVAEAEKISGRKTAFFRIRVKKGDKTIAEGTAITVAA